MFSFPMKSLRNKTVLSLIVDLGWWPCKFISLLENSKFYQDSDQNATSKILGAISVKEG